MAEIEQPAAAPLQEKEMSQRKGKVPWSLSQASMAYVVQEPMELRPACHLLGHLALLMVLQSGSLITKTMKSLTSHFTGIPTATGTEQALVARCGDQPQHPFRVVPPSRPFLYCLDLWFTCAVRIEKCSIFPSHTDSFSGILALVNWIEDSEEL